MSRNIKFRAWDSENKKMDYISFNEILNNLCADPPSRNCIKISSEWNVEEKSYEKVWMQFTGLHDKNGKDIYEGDIMKECEPKDNLGYEEKSPWVVEYNRNEEGCEYDWIGYDTWAEFCKVIGNIYENPDLLK